METAACLRGGPVSGGLCERPDVCGPGGCYLRPEVVAKAMAAVHPSPATVDVREAFAVIKNAERHIGMSPDQPGHHEVGGILTLRGLRKVFAAVRSLSTALDTEQAKVKGYEWANGELTARVVAAEALAREAGEALQEIANSYRPPSRT